MTDKPSEAFSSEISLGIPRLGSLLGPQREEAAPMFFLYGPGKSYCLNVLHISGWERHGEGVDEAYVKVRMVGGETRGMSQSDYGSLVRYLRTLGRVVEACTPPTGNPSGLTEA